MRPISVKKNSHFRPGKFRLLLAVVGIVWVSAISFGMKLLADYQSAPGKSANTPQFWPAATSLRPDSRHANLVMLMHPRCPCSRASLAELEQIMTRCQNRITAHVLFLAPKNFSADWPQTDFWRRAATIPGVLVMRDEDGREAKRFGAETSGTVVLYDQRGGLLFRGGITASRGHLGDNAGRQTVISLVTEGAARSKEAAVFGCPLFNPTSTCRDSSQPCRP